MSTPATPTTPSTSPTSPTVTLDAESDFPPSMPRDHRLRLMRSMRKITAILGETPVIETSSGGLLAPSNPAKRGFFYHASASLSSLALPFQKSDTTNPNASSSSRPSSPQPRVSHQEGPNPSRPSLFLRLPDKFEPIPSPIFSPTLDLALSPEQEQDFTRRLRMAKITRTLGENVPPALILSTPASKRRRRASTLIIPESAREQLMFQLEAAGEPSTRRAPRPGSGVRAMSSYEVTAAALEREREPTSPLHVHPVAGSPDALLSPSEWVRPLSRASSARPASMRRRRSVDGPRDPDPEGLDAPPSYDESHAHVPPHEEPFAQLPQQPREQRSFAASLNPNHAPADYNYSYAGGVEQRAPAMQRQENDWTGEWGGAVGNMDDVVRGLRGLKLK